MTQMKKRFAAITLAAALTLGLTACGGSSSAPASSKAPGASAPVESAAPQTGASEVKAAILLPGTIHDPVRLHFCSCCISCLPGIRIEAAVFSYLVIKALHLHRIHLIKAHR